MRAILSMIFVAAIAATAAAQSIDGPDSVEAGQPVWYTLKDIPPGAQAVWIPSPELQAGLPYIRDGHALLFAETPGKRSLVAIVAIVDASGRLTQLIPLTKLVEVTGEAPPEPFRESLSDTGRELEAGRGPDPDIKTSAGVRSGPVGQVPEVRRVCTPRGCIDYPAAP